MVPIYAYIFLAMLFFCIGLYSWAKMPGKQTKRQREQAIKNYTIDVKEDGEL